MNAFVRTCGTKRKYATKADAEAWIKANTRRLNYRLHSYRCPMCLHVHTGRVRRKIR